MVPSEFLSKKFMIPIPKLFFSDATGQLFDHCIQCHQTLLDDTSQYVIEKAIRRYPEYHTTDTIFEYAMCLKCHSEISKSFSQISIQSLEKYITDHVDIIERSKRLLKDENLNPDLWVSNCLIKNSAIEQLEEYQLCCMCHGNHLNHLFLPYMISNEAIEEIMELMSQKTLDELNGLKNRFFAPPPEIEKILKDPALFLI